MAARSRSQTPDDCRSAVSAIWQYEKCKKAIGIDDEAEAQRDADEVFEACATKVATQVWVDMMLALPPPIVKPFARAWQPEVESPTISRYCNRCDPAWTKECKAGVREWVTGTLLGASYQQLAFDLPDDASPNKLSKAPPRPRGHDAIREAFGDLAKAMCAFPPVVWRDRRAPTECATRALVNIAGALPPFPEKRAHPATCTVDGPSDR